MRNSLVFCLALLTSSCSFLGSRSVLHQAPARPLKHVAIIVAENTLNLTEGNAAEYLLFNKVLAEELSRRKIFRFTILDKKISPYALDNLETSLMSMELSGKYDAYLVCTSRWKGNAYKVELKLIQTDPSALLIYAKHSTAFGNSYWLYQTGGGMLHDATQGALDALSSKLEKVNRKMGIDNK